MDTASSSTTLACRDIIVLLRQLRLLMFNYTAHRLSANRPEKIVLQPVDWLPCTGSWGRGGPSPHATQVVCPVAAWCKREDYCCCVSL